MKKKLNKSSTLKIIHAPLCEQFTASASELDLQPFSAQGSITSCECSVLHAILRLCLFFGIRISRIEYHENDILLLNSKQNIFVDFYPHLALQDCSCYQWGPPALGAVSYVISRSSFRGSNLREKSWMSFLLQAFLFCTQINSSMQILVGWTAEKHMGPCISLAYQKVMTQCFSWRDTVTDCLRVWALQSKRSALNSQLYHSLIVGFCVIFFNFLQLCTLICLVGTKHRLRYFGEESRAGV